MANHKKDTAEDPEEVPAAPPVEEAPPVDRQDAINEAVSSAITALEKRIADLEALCKTFRR